MNIRIKESLNIRVKDMEYNIRESTVGVERNHIVYFYDTTRNYAVGFPKDFCLDNPTLFAVSRNIEDREVALSDVLSIVRNSLKDEKLRAYMETLVEQIQAL